MTLSLLTRGYLCPTVPGVSIATRGYLCFPLEVLLVEEDICDQLVYNKQAAALFKIQPEVSSPNQVFLTGQKQPLLGNKRSPTLSRAGNDVIYNKQSAGIFTGEDLTRVSTKGSLVIAEPTSPVLVTASGINVPSLLERCSD